MTTDVNIYGKVNLEHLNQHATVSTGNNKYILVLY